VKEVSILKHPIISLLEANPVIATLKDKEMARHPALIGVQVVFIMGGDILSMGNMMEELRARGKKAFIHIDRVEGLARDGAGVKYAASQWKPDGIITTQTQLVRTAQDAGLCTIQRLFMLDSASLASGLQLVSQSKPHMIELLPGIVPKAIAFFREKTDMPIISGGMVTEKSEIVSALAAGALAVSTSNTGLWSLKKEQLK
jgi:glycerol uptake operon antiterminator